MHDTERQRATRDAAAPDERHRAMPNPPAIIAIAWSLALVAVVAARFRGEWEAYKSLHRWLASSGVPDWARNLDSLILFAVAAFVGAALIARSCGGTAAARLQLRQGRPGGLPMAAIALLPMVGGGLVLGLMRWTTDVTFAGLLSRFIGGVIRAPIAEELLFRGLLVGACAAALGWSGMRFWSNAVAAALLFAAIHVTWTFQSVANGWPTLLMTGAGGLWYSWLLARWQTLWVPMVLHAGMNLGWLLAGATGGAGGGGWVENLLRVATIAVATWWTIRRTAAFVAA